MRLIVCAGVLTSGVLIGAGSAWADTGDAADAGSDAAAVTSKSDDKNSESGEHDASNPDRPTATFGDGRENVGVESGKEEKKNDQSSPATKKFKNFFTIPVPRIPKQDELPANGLPNPELFYTTLVIPVPTLADLLNAALPQPPPPPTPRPTFRTQPPEAPPEVVDSGGGGGGGVDPLATGVAAQPPVVHAPIVIAPLTIPLPRTPKPAPLGATAGVTPAPVVADAAVAGARTPLIRGSLQPTVAPAERPLASTTGEATRMGYPRYLRNPSSGELTLMALPGVAGLLVLTLSGGVIGYRQADSARFIRTQPAARFLR